MAAETEFMKKHRLAYEGLRAADLTIEQMVALIYVIDSENGENDSTQTFRKIVDAATNDVHSWLTQQMEERD